VVDTLRARGLVERARDARRELDESLLSYTAVVQDRVGVALRTALKDRNLYAAESAAQSAGRGLWACRDPATAARDTGATLAVVTVHADAAGNDHENLGDEYVQFLNVGNGSLDLAGWTVSDAAGHRYRFPAGSYIHTETCQKYTLDSVRRLIDPVPLAVVERWTDPGKLFFSVLFKPTVPS
jgi:hypothetical protein